MKKLIHLFAYFSCICITIWGIGFILFCLYACSFKYMDVKQSDGIAVLTGGIDRIQTGIDLMQKHQSNQLLISGVNKDVPPKKLLNLLPPDLHNQITLGYIATDTQGNALEVNQWITKNKIDSLILVTSFYHMPRSIFEISKQNGGLEIRPYPVFPKSFNNSVDWLKTRYAWLLFIEYHKFIYVHIDYFLRKVLL